MRIDSSLKHVLLQYAAYVVSKAGACQQNPMSGTDAEWRFSYVNYCL
jgi:hypothetical protein